MVLFIGHLFHPVDWLAIEMLLNRNVRHGRDGLRAVPMLFTGREPDYVTRTNVFDWPAPALRSDTAGRNDERLTQGVRVPGGACTGFEGNAGASDTRRICGLEQRVNTDCAR